MNNYDTNKIVNFDDYKRNHRNGARTKASRETAIIIDFEANREGSDYWWFEIDPNVLDSGLQEYLFLVQSKSIERGNIEIDLKLEGRTVGTYKEGVDLDDLKQIISAELRKTRSSKRMAQIAITKTALTPRSPLLKLVKPVAD